MHDPAPTEPTGGAIVRLTGADALAVLHRVTTAHLADLAPGQARATLFCDFRARLQQRAIVGVTADGAVWLVRDDAPAEGLLAAVDRAVFREDVTLADAGAGRHVRLRDDERALAPGTLREVDGVPRALRADDGLALEIVDGAAPAPGDDATRERVRVLRPAHGHEIVDEFTPFEVALAHEVHLSKGCFTGQETLMRLVTYRGTRRSLARVSGDGAPHATPAELLRDGERAGRLTTVVADRTGWIGLAVVTLAADGAEPALALADGRAVRVTERASERRPRGLPER